MRSESPRQIMELTNIVGISQNFPATSASISGVGDNEDK